MSSSAILIIPSNFILVTGRQATGTPLPEKFRREEVIHCPAFESRSRHLKLLAEITALGIKGGRVLNCTLWCCGIDGVRVSKRRFPNLED